METRIVARVDIDLRILFRLPEGPTQQFALAAGKSFEANALDISVLGIGVLSRYFLPHGLILDLEIDGKLLGLNEVIKVKGEIRYCRYLKDVGYRCGIKFLDLSEDYQKAITKFISTSERRGEPRIKLAE